MWSQARCWIGGVALFAIACGGMAGAPAAANADEPAPEDLPYAKAPPPPPVMATSEWNAAHRRSDRPLVVYTEPGDIPRLDPDRIDQLLEAPEGVDVEMAGGGKSLERRLSQYAPSEASEAAVREQVYAVERGRGCGCRSAGPTDTRFWALFVGAIAVLFARRRHSGVRSTA